MPTTVVDLHGITPERFERLGVIYCGRAMRRHKIEAIRRGSPLGNPYRGGSVQNALERYYEHLLSRPDLLALLPALQGKMIGCWCADTVPDDIAHFCCHGQIVAALADGRTF